MNSITFIGAGNVAWHLAQAFKTKNFAIRQIWSRTFKAASELAAKVDAVPVTDLTKVGTDSDIYFICVNDAAIASVSSQLVLSPKLVLHTSGSVAMDALRPISERIGVLYPLQTFSKQAELDISQVPFYIESADAKDIQHLHKLASTISTKVDEATSQRRQKIHLAAVFANNFSNFLFTVASDILESENFKFDILKPLIAETFRKVVEMHPALAQTGPARRGDHAVLMNHLEILKQYPDYQSLYGEISKLIDKRYKLK